MKLKEIIEELKQFDPESEVSRRQILGDNTYYEFVIQSPQTQHQDQVSEEWRHIVSDTE